MRYSDLSQDGECVKMRENLHNRFVSCRKWAPSVGKGKEKHPPNGDVKGTPTKTVADTHEVQIRRVIATGQRGHGLHCVCEVTFARACSRRVELLLLSRCPSACRKRLTSAAVEMFNTNACKLVVARLCPLVRAASRGPEACWWAVLQNDWSKLIAWFADTGNIATCLVDCVCGFRSQPRQEGLSPRSHRTIDNSTRVTGAMDPLSIAASVAGLLSLAGGVAQLSRELYSLAKKKPDGLIRLAERLDSFRAVLDELEDEYQFATADTQAEQRALTAVSKSCEETLRQLQGNLLVLRGILSQNIWVKLSSRSQFNAVMENVREACENLEAFKLTLSIALQLRCM